MPCVSEASSPRFRRVLRWCKQEGRAEPIGLLAVKPAQAHLDTPDVGCPVLPILKALRRPFRGATDGRNKRLIVGRELTQGHMMQGLNPAPMDYLTAVRMLNNRVIG